MYNLSSRIPLIIPQLVRGPFAWLGTAWMGPCPWTAGACQGQHGKYKWHTELETDVV